MFNSIYGMYVAFLLSFIGSYLIFRCTLSRYLSLLTKNRKLLSIPWKKLKNNIKQRIERWLTLKYFEIYKDRSELICNLFKVWNYVLWTLFGCFLIIVVVNIFISMFSIMRVVIGCVIFLYIVSGLIFLSVDYYIVSKARKLKVEFKELHRYPLPVVVLVEVIMFIFLILSVPKFF